MNWNPAVETESGDQDKKGWVSSALNMLPFFNKPGDRRALSISIAQTIYTPEDLERSDLILDDRPYAGYTYLGVAVHRTTPKIMDTLELDIGIVGPHSYAQDVQEWAHRVFDSTEPKGWSNQLEDEFTLELIYERKWRLLASNLSFSRDQGDSFYLYIHIPREPGDFHR